MAQERSESARERRIGLLIVFVFLFFKAINTPRRQLPVAVSKVPLAHRVGGVVQILEVGRKQLQGFV